MAQIYSNNAIARITAPFYSGGTTLHIDPARAPLFPQPQRLEHLYITITTIFDGETVVSTWDNSPTDIRPLISINRLTSTPSAIQVEISNLMLGKEE